MAFAQNYVRVNVMFDRSVATTVAEKLGNAGMLIDRELDLLSIICGRVRPERMGELASVEGVLAVEEDRGVQLFDPTSGPGADGST